MQFVFYCSCVNEVVVVCDRLSHCVGDESVPRYMYSLTQCVFHNRLLCAVVYPSEILSADGVSILAHDLAQFKV